MSFFGKKWKKESFENVSELMDVLNLGDNIRALLNKPDAIVYFLDNGDGSIQHVAELNGVKAFNQQLVLGEEAPFTGPGGIEATQVSSLDGDTLTTTYSADGKSLTFSRAFEDDTMTMTISGDFFDITATIGYTQVE